MTFHVPAIILNQARNSGLGRYEKECGEKVTGLETHSPCAASRLMSSARSNTTGSSRYMRSSHMSEARTEEEGNAARRSGPLMLTGSRHSVVEMCCGDDTCQHRVGLKER